MKKNLIFASFLALGMGLAQAQQPGQSTAPGQSGSLPNGSSPTDPGATKTRAQAPADRGQATTASGNTAMPDAGPQQSFNGCLTQASGKWSLASDNGQTIAISGSDDQLSSHNNQQVKIQGIQGDDGTVKVSSIDKVADSCNNSGQAATSSSTDQNARAPASTSSGAAATTADQTTTNSTSTTNTTPEQSSTASTQSATPSETTSSPATSNRDQNAGVGASGNNRSATAGQSVTSTTSNDQNANSDNSIRHISDMDDQRANANNRNAVNADQNAGQKLPQTASPLPLLGLLGLGSLVTGLVARRKK
jgi:trimeric autotransporter adhesin